jgi:uncharacterized SAM-binding protein YcdF (DUF218 family)
MLGAGPIKTDVEHAADVEEDGMRQPSTGVPTARTLLRCIGKSGLWAMAAATVALAAGFVLFVSHVPEQEVQLSGKADGIVALTGGASRIADAIELLASGSGRRLLISGASRATNSHEISRLNPEFERWIRCCVDFDRSVNTLGNAIEIKRWSEQRGFRSLIIVTSNYHMPRALAEIAHQMPEVALLPFPVIPGRQRVEPWWANSVTARLMFTEYVKLILARLRMVIHAVAGSNELS